MNRFFVIYNFNVFLENMISGSKIIQGHKYTKFLDLIVRNIFVYNINYLFSLYFQR